MANQQDQWEKPQLRSAMYCLLGSFICAGIAAEDGSSQSGAESIGDWGKLVDPDGGSHVTLDDDVLRIQFGTGPRMLDSENGGHMNAPRVVQSIDGNFAIQVVVDGNLPLPDPAQVRDRAYMSGGLLVMQK